jgi:hypothetical protein
LKLTGNCIFLGTKYHAVECWPGVITLFETVRSGINCKAKHFVANAERYCASLTSIDLCLFYHSWVTRLPPWKTSMGQIYTILIFPYLKLMEIC